MVKAKDFVRICKRLGVETTELPRVLKEALEIEMAAIADGIDVGKTTGRLLYTRRSYGRDYTER